jgi:hypothetical protein
MLPMISTLFPSGGIVLNPFGIYFDQVVSNAPSRKITSIRSFAEVFIGLFVSLHRALCK